jgi:hypothetical protein
LPSVARVALGALGGFVDDLIHWLVAHLWWRARTHTVGLLAVSLAVRMDATLHLGVVRILRRSVGLWMTHGAGLLLVGHRGCLL